MTKEILLTLTGLQLFGEENEAVEIVTVGEYYKRGDRHYILYEEAVEGLSGHISNIVKIGENSLEVLKKGLTNTRMVLEKGKRHTCLYQTPYGELSLGFLGREIRIEESDRYIHVNAEYLLEISEKSMVECTMNLEIRPREAGNLKLS